MEQRQPPNVQPTKYYKSQKESTYKVPANNLLDKKTSKSLQDLSKFSTYNNIKPKPALSFSKNPQNNY